MDTKVYYELRNKSNHYADQEGLKDAYEYSIQKLEQEFGETLYRDPSYFNCWCSESYKCKNNREFNKLIHDAWIHGIDYIAHHSAYWVAYTWLHPDTVRKIKNIYNRYQLIKQKQKQLEDLEHLNTLLLDYDEVLITPSSKYRYLI